MNYDKLLENVQKISHGEKLLFNHNSVIKEYDELDLIKIAYIEYKQYIIPICINKTTDKELIRKYNFSFVQHTKKLHQACIIIHEILWENLSLNEIKCILYHELAHAINADFFTEALADEFAVAHVGSKNYFYAQMHSCEILNDHLHSLEFDVSLLQYQLIRNSVKRIKDTMKIIIELEEYKK